MIFVLNLFHHFDKKNIYSFFYHHSSLALKQIQFSFELITRLLSKLNDFLLVKKAEITNKKIQRMGAKRVKKYIYCSILNIFSQEIRFFWFDKAYLLVYLSMKLV